ncbi:ABC transporter ATP-binding protein [Allobacillus sp. GCM10007491]|uniref:ABC transporter ATP-binding protein n=1 Tax=Allobacillus saliphilus TaxID=2912308 RepID=A0A941CY42_9BACI|nr:ABC transporter ATP-binding protein [Allobacillus saliphilus]MBR7554896.1 ABC transporter ATP-binding protein [Allobacillus saliphilus]
MIEVKDIVKRFGRKTVLDQVSFTAEKGQITCLIGVNGMGKTTIMNAIMKLTPLQAGEILVDGEKVTKDTFEKIVFIPDATIMLPHFTIEMAMEFMKDFYKNWNQRRADDMLAFFKLNRKDKIASLSKGNTAKVNLLLGLAVDADYILMDEPFSGIDIFSREQIAEVFTSHLIEDRGVLITTHEIGDIEHLIDKVVILNDGKIQKEFMTEDVRELEGKSVIDVLREVFVQ